MTSRRDFLRLSTFTTLSLAAMPGLASVFSRSYFERISVSETFSFPRWFSAVKENASLDENIPDREFISAWQSGKSPTGSLRKASELQLLTLSAPGVEPFGVREARALSMQANDKLAEKIGTSFGTAGLATVSAFDPLAVKEAERAVMDLHLVGLSVGANRGLRLDHKSLWPLYEFSAAAKVPIYLPATYSAAVGESPYQALGRVGVITGAAADSGRHAMQLIFGGVLDAFPTLIVVLSRMGEGTPYWYGRIEEMYSSIGDAGGVLPQRTANEYFQENILLTTTDMTQQTLEFCNAFLGEGRVVTSCPQSALQLDADLIGNQKLNRVTQVRASYLLGSA